MVSKKSLRDKNLKRICGKGRVDLISGIIRESSPEMKTKKDLILLIYDHFGQMDLYLILIILEY